MSLSLTDINVAIKALFFVVITTVTVFRVSVITVIRSKCHWYVSLHSITVYSTGSIMIIGIRKRETIKRKVIKAIEVNCPIVSVSTFIYTSILWQNKFQSLQILLTIY